MSLIAPGCSSWRVHRWVVCCIGAMSALWGCASEYEARLSPDLDRPPNHSGSGGGYLRSKGERRAARIAKAAAAVGVVVVESMFDSQTELSGGHKSGKLRVHGHHGADEPGLDDGGFMRRRH